MSKKDLKMYLSGLKKKQLEEQIEELYDKFKEVKVFYEFAFHPNEKNLVKDAKIKISNEYFPNKSKRPKMRRSVAQKYIKHFITLGVDEFIIADLMLFNIEIAQTLSAEKNINSITFYKSMLTSFQQAVAFMIEKNILEEYKKRLIAIKNESEVQNWTNCYEINAVLERLIY